MALDFGACMHRLGLHWRRLDLWPGCRVLRGKGERGALGWRCIAHLHPRDRGVARVVLWLRIVPIHWVICLGTIHVLDRLAHIGIKLLRRRVDWCAGRVGIEQHWRVVRSRHGRHVLRYWRSARRRREIGSTLLVNPARLFNKRSIKTFKLKQTDHHTDLRIARVTSRGGWRWLDLLFLESFEDS